MKAHPELALDYLVVPPRMAHYIEWSTKIYNVYLKYVAPSDISAYSIDEVLMDVTNYLPTYKLTPRELARKIVLDVLDTTGITATAGIGACIWQRWPWISGPSTPSRTKAVYALRRWMR